MNQSNINYLTLALSLMSVIKLILQPFGIDLSHVTDEQVNSIVNGFAALFAIGGVIYNHFKKPKQNGGTVNESTLPTITIDNNR